MTVRVTIGEVARRTGLPVRTIRFYESEGVVAAPPRSDSGYRLYGPTDVRRLRLARRARLLGLPLPAVKALVEQAFQSECVEFGEQLLARIQEQRARVDQQMAELTALRDELIDLERHVRHCQAEARPGQTVAECAFCPMIDEEGGETDGHDPVPVPVR